MTCRSLRSSAWLALSIGILAAGPAAGQTPSSTWTATTSGNWSTGTNWTPAGPPASSNATVLQFNANGTASYTATNDIADPFALQGLIFNSTSSNPITLAGNVGGTGTGALAFSTSGPYIYQNNTGAVVINNDMTTNNSSSGSDLSFGGYGSGTVTINGAISGNGGVNFTNLGGATFVFANGNNSFTGANPNGLSAPFGPWAPFGTIMATATSGTPLGGGTLFFYDGTTAIAPATTGPPSDVTVGTAAGRNVQLFSGGTLVLDKGGNTSLTFTANAFAVTLSSNSSGTLAVAPASGIANLGLVNQNTGTPMGETFTVTLAPTTIGNMLQPTLVGQASKTDTTGDFLTYYNGPTTVGTSTYNGLAQVPQANPGLGIQGYTTYGTAGGSFSADTTGTEISNVTANTTANASPTIQALRVTNSTLTIASGQNVTVGGQTWNSPHQQAGLILNNSTIAGPGTLTVGGATPANNELDIYASSAGMSVISAQIVSTNPGGTTPALVKFGPGNVVLTNTANQFPAGAVFTLYDTGALVIPASTPGVLGTGTRTFIMRGGAFGITGGNWTASNVSLNLVQGGGGFFVDSNSTLTLSSSVLGFLGATTGTGPLYKTGAGTLTFSSPINTGNTLTGLQVQQGTLLVTTAISGNSPTGPNQNLPTVVNSTGILAGNGSVPGVVVINGGGAIAPGVGTTIGAFTDGGDIFQGGGAYTVKYNQAANSPTAGVDNDTIFSTSGALDLSGLSSGNKFTLNLVPTPTGSPSGNAVSFNIGSFSSVVLPAGASGSNLTSLFNVTGAFSGTPSVSLLGNNLELTLTPQNQWTWNGSVSGSWANAANWTPAVTPTGGLNVQLTFGSTANATMTNDISGTFGLNEMIFNAGSPAYSLAGNGLNFLTSSAGTTPQILSNSTNSITITAPLTLTNTLTVNSKANVTLNGAIGGAGGLTFSSPTGTLTLGNAANTYAGGTNVLSGTVSVAADGDLGTGNVTGQSLGTVLFTGSTTTARTFSMGGGTVAVAAGQTLTVNGGVISGGYVDGAGTLATGAANGAQLVNVTTTPSVSITSNNANDRFVRITNSAALTVAPGVNSSGTSTTVNLDTFTNEGLGSVTVGAGSRINVSGFQTYGTVTLVPGPTAALATRLTNVGTAVLGFNAGSRTFIATPATAGQNLALVDLHGHNAVVAGGLFVNNGFVGDSTSSGATVIADYGTLVKGAGIYANPVITQNGGKFQAGNSPGKATFGQLVLGPGGTQAFNWQINNAAGVAGPSADANNQVSGWSLLSAEKIVDPFTGLTSSGDMTWTATSQPGSQFNMALQTLINPITVGQDTQGLMANFDNTHTIGWKLVSWQGNYTGPTDDATLTSTVLFDASNFVNPVLAGSSFQLHYNAAGKEIDVVYAVPEPGTLALVGAAALAGLRLRRKKAKAATA